MNNENESLIPLIRIGIVTVSDRASRGEYEDLGGPAIHEYLNRVIVEDWAKVSKVFTFSDRLFVNGIQAENSWICACSHSELDLSTSASCQT